MYAFTPQNSEDRVTFRSHTVTLTVLYGFYYSLALLCTLSPAYGVVRKKTQTAAQQHPRLRSARHCDLDRYHIQLACERSHVPMPYAHHFVFKLG